MLSLKGRGTTSRGTTLTGDSREEREMQIPEEAIYKTAFR